MTTFFAPNVAADLFAQQLSAQYRLGMRLWDQSIALRNDPEAYETVLNSGMIRQCFDRRTMLAAGLKWDVEASSARKDDKRAAKILQRLIKETRSFHESRKHLAKDCIYGTSYGRVEWEPTFLDVEGNGDYREWVVPRRIRPIDRRMIRGVPKVTQGRANEPGTVDVEWERFSEPDARWFRIDDRDKANYIRHSFDDSPDRLGYGRGLIDCVYFLWYFRNAVIEEWANGIEFWSRGFIEVAIKNSDTGTKINQAIVDKYQEQIERHRSRHSYVHDATDEVKITQGGGEGGAICMQFVAAIEKEIRTTINHSSDNVASNEGGSYARADVHADSEQMVAESDRMRLSERLTLGLVRRCFDLNYVNFCSLGMAAANPGEFAILDRQVNDPEKTARTFQTVLQSGAAIGKKHFYSALQIPIPDEDEETIEPMAPPAPPSFGMGGLGAPDPSLRGLPTPDDLTPKE